MQETKQKHSSSESIIEELGTTDILFDSRYCALYTAAGELIESSILTRGEDEKVTAPPPTIKPDINPLYIEEAIFIHSFGYHHYGHFLTEQIAKLWYLQKSHLPVIFHNNIPKKTSRLFWCFEQLPQYQQGFLNKVAGFHPNRLVFTEQQIKLGKVILPTASFVIRKRAHVSHRDLCQSVAKHICTVQERERVIYLSRSKLHNAKRQVRGERELETKLVSIGVEIIYPETLNLAQQIKLVNSTKTIIGCVGSALHTLLFCLSSDFNVITLANPSINTNFLLIDELMELNNYYINCLTDFDKASDNVEMNVELAFSGIKQILPR
jgi:capsular polysaccharide biosynthesis protein